MRVVLTMAGLMMGVAVLLVDLVHGAASSLSSLSSRAVDVASVLTIVQNQAAKLTEMEATINRLQHVVQQHEHKLSHTVAFHARMSSRNFVAAGQTFIFDHLDANAAIAYNTNTGVFTVPVAGFYAFFFSVYGRDGTTGAAYLQIDDRPVVFVDGQNEIETGHGVFHLGPGQTVKVVANRSSVKVNTYNTCFTGYLVNPDY